MMATLADSFHPPQLVAMYQLPQAREIIVSAAVFRFVQSSLCTRGILEGVGKEVGDGV